MLTTNTNPYALTATAGFAKRIEGITKDIARQAIVDSNHRLVYTIGEENKEIGQFEHPVIFSTPGQNRPRVAIDGRLFKSQNPMIKEQLLFQQRRAAITLHCTETGGCGDLFDPSLQIAYATVIAGCLARQFNFDPVTKLQITAVVGAFYYYITRPDGDVRLSDDTDRMIVTKSIVRNLRIPADMAESVMTRIVPGRDLETLVANIKTIDDSDRTFMLSPALIITTLNGLWFGVNAAQMLAICLEHPPTWACMIHAAVGEGSLSRTELAKRLKNLGLIKQRVPQLNSIINHLTAGMDDDR